MSDVALYHDGSRELQDRFQTRRLADRLQEVIAHDVFTEADRAFIESRPMFFLATADAAGRPDCSYKGGRPGFVRVVGPGTLAFPSYDGNGMFKSLGNMRSNPQVGLLFIAMTEKPKRLRVLGRAEIAFDDPLLANFPGGQLLVRIRPTHVFPNCPRYIPDMKRDAPSVYVPEAGRTPVEPAWKGYPEFKDVVPPRKPTA